MHHRHRCAAQDLAEKDQGARHRRNQYLAQEPEFAVPDHRNRGLDRRIENVQHDDGGKDELEVGVGDDEPGFAIHLTPEIRVEADAEQDHPQDRTAEAPDKLPAIAQCTLDLAQPDCIKRAQLTHRCLHPVSHQERISTKLICPCSSPASPDLIRGLTRRFISLPSPACGEGREGEIAGSSPAMTLHKGQREAAGSFWRWPISGQHNVGCDHEPKREVTYKRNVDEDRNDCEPGYNERNDMYAEYIKHR